MARSKYYGYTTSGYPFKRWTLSELPMHTVSVFNASTVATVTAGSNFPITGTVINQTGANLQGNSVWIPGGFYRVTWTASLDTSAAAQLIVTMTGNSGTISTTYGANQTVGSNVVPSTLNREIFITVGPQGTTLSLQNAGTTSVTTTGDFQLSIARLL